MSDNTPNGSPSDVPEGYPGAPTPPAAPATPPNAYFPQPSTPPYPAEPSAPAYGGQPTPPAYGAQQQYGYPAAPGYGYPPAQKTNGLAITSLVASIANFVILPFIGAVVGVITGHMALKQLKTSGEAGRGLALAGTIVGWVGVGLTLIGVVIAILWFSWFFTEIANSSGYTYSS